MKSTSWSIDSTRAERSVSVKTRSSGRALGGGGFFEEALEEAHQRARDLVAGVDREALAGSLDLAGAERPDERDVAAALRRDDRAVAASRELELDRAQMLVVGAHGRDIDAQMGRAGFGGGAVEAVERRGHLAAQLFDALSRALEARAVF